MPETRTVVLVGHCGPDMFMLRSAVKRLLPDSTLTSVNSEAKLQPYLNSQSVLLVNRVLDGRFPGGSGIELIRQIAAGSDPPVSILISNFPEAQAEAIEAGARPGFGKTQLYDGKTAEILRSAAE